LRGDFPAIDRLQHRCRAACTLRVVGDHATGRQWCCGRGLWGHLYYDRLFFELLFVPESVRGQRFGTRLLAQAEAVAREKDCVGIWLDSFSFQVPGFYLKRGFEAWGTLENYLHGHRRVFLRRRLEPLIPMNPLQAG
jgi:GNAT superfamily N-acetyltransferase